VKNRLPIVVLGLGLALTSCVHSPRSVGPSKSPTPTTSTGRLTISLEITLKAHPQISSLTTWGHYVAWAAGDSARIATDRIVLYDRNARRMQVVARMPGKELDWVRGSGEFLTYTVLYGTPSDAKPDVPWEIRVFDIQHRRTTVVEKSKNTFDEKFAPFPDIDWPYLTNGDPSLHEGDLDGITAVYNLRTGHRRVITGAAASGRITIDHGLVAFDARSPAGRDLYVASAASGNARRLTKDGLVSLPRVRNGAVAWQEPPTGDAMSAWYMSLTAQVPIKLARGSGDMAVPGNGFVLWCDRLGDELVVYDALSPTALPVHLRAPPSGYRLSISARWDASGDTLVWADEDQNVERGAFIHIARAERS
jgi:hypothetical protein